MSHQPSQSFHEAASFLSSSSALADLSNNKKLEIYGIFKFLTALGGPRSSRPSLFDISGRAKWDAWQEASKTWEGREVDAELHYKEIAKRLGWNSGSRNDDRHDPDNGEVASKEVSLDLEDDNQQATSRRSDLSFGVVVSTGQRASPLGDGDPNSIHSYAILGDANALVSLLHEKEDLDVNQLDDYGFTPLHLACDRGNLGIVQILIDHHADPHIKDPDGFSVIDLACEGDHSDIVDILEKYIKEQ